MKTIKVVAAIILHEGKIFATQRGYGEFKEAFVESYYSCLETQKNRNETYEFRNV